MVAELERDGHLDDPRLKRAFLQVRRHEFLPRGARHLAYGVEPIDALEDQTMTCPGFVAQMTSLLEVSPGDRVLDVGTGTGYQAAILAAMGCRVPGVEVRPAPHALATENLARAGFPDLEVRLGDGALGLEGAAPFDAILVTAAPARVPPRLLAQLSPEGRLVLPVGDAHHQELLVLERTAWGETRRRSVTEVAFVPLR